MLDFSWGEIGVMLVLCGMSAYCALKYRFGAQASACEDCMDAMQKQLEMRIEERVTKVAGVAYDDGYQDGRQAERAWEDTP